MPKITAEELQQFLKTEFPLAPVFVEHVGEKTARVRQEVCEADVRPGNTISGPTMMALADTATYVAILAQIGLVPLAVTTSLTINFMRKPAADRPLLADATLLKLGARLAVCEVRIVSQGLPDLLAHAMVTYSIPPERQ